MKKLINSSVALLMGVSLFYSFNSSVLASDRWTSWKSFRGKGVTACSKSHARNKARNLCKKNLYKGEKVVQVDLDDYDVVYGRTGFMNQERYCNYVANYRCKIRTNYSNNSSGSGYQNNGYSSNNCATYGLSSTCAPHMENKLPKSNTTYDGNIAYVKPTITDVEILMTPLGIRQRRFLSSPKNGKVKFNSCRTVTNCTKVKGIIWCSLLDSIGYSMGYIPKTVFYKNKWRHTFKYGCN